DPDDDRQNLFIQQVREDEETQYGAEVIESSIEEFKYAVHDKLKEIEPAPRTAEISSKSPLQLTVYLAEANYELETHRENIKKQLLQRGCRVLPEHPLPLYYPELAETLDNLLEQSDIAVHIIGEGYGIVPDKTRKSIIHIQHERTGEKVQQGKLKRIVHLSPTIDEGDERQATFTAGLKSRTSALPGDHIIETAPQHLETAVMEKYRIIEEKHLQALAGANEPTVETGAGDETGSEPRQIYLICDLADLDAVTGLEDFLYESGFDVRLPVFEGDEADILEDHRENLKTCDAVMIYYGAGSEIWLRSVTRDITKAAGYGRTRPMLVESVFLAPPETRQKVRFRSHDTLIINGLEGFSPSLLAPFIEKLDKGSGGVGQ
ncbi:MAG: hypothetical protein KAW12_05405, partial [Candidatus Aminicenantes bacterium]|nr:hypothetical protein [Candidatus Aminicenantes bacterium]